MKIEKQVCSLGTCDDAQGTWRQAGEPVLVGGILGGIIPDEKAKWRLAQGGIENDREGEWYAAFTVAELG